MIEPGETKPTTSMDQRVQHQHAEQKNKTKNNKPWGMQTDKEIPKMKTQNPGTQKGITEGLQQRAHPKEAHRNQKGTKAQRDGEQTQETQR